MTILEALDPYVDKINELEKENVELKTQIEKMRCCQNCKHDYMIGDYEPCNECNDEYDRWEIRK